MVFYYTYVMAVLILVIPGYLDSGINIQDWAGFAHKNKALLITDFEDSMTCDDLMLRLEKSNLQSSNRNNSSVVVACNYILAALHVMRICFASFARCSFTCN